MAEPDQGSHSVAGIFDLTRRGYDRRQVDDHLQHLLVQLSEAERARRREESRANRAEAELGELRERLRDGGSSSSSPEHPETDRFAMGGDSDGGRHPGSAHQGFGLRVEKLLRAAEQEAAETRDGATREAADLLEQARADADAHRREREHSLTARETEIDKKAFRRTVELDERERQVAEQGATARDEADRLLTEARVRAEQIEAEARGRATQQYAETEKAVDERRAAADDELARLRAVRRGVRGDLARMLSLLAGELERPEPEPEPDAEGDVDGEAGGVAAGDGVPDWFGPDGERPAEHVPSYPAVGR